VSEKSQRTRVTRALKPLHGFAVENVCLPGTPDVNCTLGWIELKWIEDWPARASTPVRLEHYTPQQRIFAQKRGRAGGLSLLLLQVESTQDWLLFDGPTAARIVGHVPRAELFEGALAHWVGHDMEKNLVPCLYELFENSRSQSHTASPADAPAERKPRRRSTNG